MRAGFRVFLTAAMALATHHTDVEMGIILGQNICGRTCGQRPIRRACRTPQQGHRSHQRVKKASDSPLSRDGRNGRDVATIFGVLPHIFSHGFVYYIINVRHDRHPSRVSVSCLARQDLVSRIFLTTFLGISCKVHMIALHLSNSITKVFQE